MRVDANGEGAGLALDLEHGGFTWGQEGQDSGPYASQAVHWPGGASGVTIGRGYDMGQRTGADVRADLVGAGLTESDAAALSAAAGLRGADAAQFVKSQRTVLPALTSDQQKKLFSSVVFPRYQQEAQRLVSKADVIAQYGALDFEQIPSEQKALVIDLTFRGDNTPATREVLQPALISNDKTAICEALRTITALKSVPFERAKARRNLIGCR